jgi:hypothetical protein
MGGMYENETYDSAANVGAGVQRRRWGTNPVPRAVYTTHYPPLTFLSDASTSLSGHTAASISATPIPMDTSANR